MVVFVYMQVHTKSKGILFHKDSRIKLYHNNICLAEVNLKQTQMAFFILNAIEITLGIFFSIKSPQKRWSNAS